MNAKATDLARIQTIIELAELTNRQMAQVRMTRERFIHPQGAMEQLVVEGLTNRVFRVSEEAGRISEAVAAAYGFETAGIRGVRNRLAHVYDEVDSEILWTVLTKDFDGLLEKCYRFCEDHGLEPPAEMQEHEGV